MDRSTHLQRVVEAAPYEVADGLDGFRDLEDAHPGVDFFGLSDGKSVRVGPDPPHAIEGRAYLREIVEGPYTQNMGIVTLAG